MCRIRVNVYIYILTNTQAHTSAIIRHCFSHTATSLHWNRYIWFTILFSFYQHFQMQTSNSFPICVCVYIYESIVTSTCTCTFLPTRRFIAEVKVFLWFSFGSVGLYQKTHIALWGKIISTQLIPSFSPRMFFSTYFQTFINVSTTFFI